jgi:hypothetical protein
VTGQVAILSQSIKQDDRIAALIAGDRTPTYVDATARKLSDFLKGCGGAISANLASLQEKYHSEFPSINVVQLIRSGGSQNGKVGVQLSTSLLLRRLYDSLNLLGDADDLEQREEAVNSFKRASGDFADAIERYGSEIEFNLTALGQAVDEKENCYNLDRTGLWQDMEFYVGTGVSNTLGYLAALTAFSEFADGNRESAIRLLDDRIAKEIDNETKISKGSASPSYSQARKRALITRLIRWQSNLVELVQTPERSAALDQIQFNRVTTGMQYHPFGLISKDPGKFVLDVLGQNSADCPKTIKLSDGRKVILDARKDSVSFYTSLYTEVVFMNNALDYISKNGGAVRSLNWGLDADLIKASRLAVSESDLIRQMDLIADRLLKLSQSNLATGREPLSCLVGEGLPVYQTTLSAFLETVGDYFDSKGRNFGSSAGPPAGSTI